MSLTPDQAREQLAAVDILTSSTRATARSRAHVGAYYTGAIGLLVGGVVIATRAFVGRNAVAFALTFVVYTVGLVGLTVYLRRTQTVSGRGWGRLYTWSLLTTMALYVAAISWISTHTSAPWLLVCLSAAAVALPMLLAAARMRGDADR